MIHLVLAQVDPVKPLADGFASNFLPYALGVCVITIGALAKILLFDVSKATEARERAHDAELAAVQKTKDAELAALQKSKDEAIAALNAQLLTQALSHAGEIRKTLEQVLPLQRQLAEMIHLTVKE